MTMNIMERSSSILGKEVILPRRRTQIYRSVDVLVCGGGLSGVAAAVAAARSGAQTLLVERNVVLGGSGPLSFDIRLAPAQAGLAGEVRQRLEQTGDLGMDLLADELVHDPEALKYVLLDLLQEADVQLLLASWVADPIIRDGIVRGAMVENKSGRFAIPAGIVIDATGDAELALRAGAKTQDLEGQVSVQMNYRIGGVDLSRALEHRSSWRDKIAEAKAAGQLSQAQPDHIHLYGITPQVQRRNMAYVHGPVVQADASWTPREFGEAEGRARELIRDFLPFLRSVPGFDNSFLVDVAGTLAVGRRRHLVGERTLDAADVASFGSDAVGNVPEECLRSRDVRGLLVTGKALSANEAGWQALERESSSLIVGECAGRIAAEAVTAHAPSN